MRRIDAGPLTVLPLWSALAAGAWCGLAPATVRADAGDPDDWSVALPARFVLDVAWAQDRIYAAIDPGGVLVYDPATRQVEQLTTAGGLGSNRIQCVAVNGDGEVWAGSTDAGITRIFPDGRTRILTALPGQLAVRGIAFSGDNAYYGGPNGAGRVVSGLPERTFTPSDGLVNDDVRAVAARGGKAWFATAGGVSEFDIQLNGLVTRNDGLTELDVRAIAVGGGRVYAATPTRLWILDESDPQAPVWELTDPVISAEIVDLAGRGDRIVALGTDRRVWWRDAADAAWTFAQAGQPDHRFLAVTLDDGLGVHLGGRRFDLAPLGTDITPLFLDPDGVESPYYRQLYGDQFLGLGPDREGGVWVGAFPVDAAVSHWRADGQVVCYTDEETGNANDGFANDGWLPQLKIDMFEASDGALWVSTFQAGVTRMVPAADGDPAGASYLHVTPDNSPLDMDRVYSMAEDPHGNIWFCAAGELIEGSFNAGIDILLDPGAPFDPASWVSIRTDNSFLAGAGLNRITFEGDRVAWLTVRGAGVQRFLYGDGTGFDPDRLDDEASWRLIDRLPENRIEANLGKAIEVAVGRGSRRWIATTDNGLFAFDYTVGSIVSSRQYRSESLGARLLSDEVRAVTVDATGAVWAATAIGFNRIVESGFEATSTAYTDLQNYLDFGLGEIYSTQVLRPLPGGIPVALATSEAAPRLFMVSGRGVSRVELTGDPAPPPTDDEPEFALYPNPVREGDQLVLDGFEGEARVEIYDLQGRALRRTTARPGDVVWRMETLSGNPVASGLYLVRFIQNGRSATRVLAVER